MKIGDKTPFGTIRNFRIVEVDFEQREMKFTALCTSDTGHDSEVPLADLAPQSDPDTKRADESDASHGEPSAS